MNDGIYQTLPELLKEEPSIVQSLGLHSAEIFVPECAHAVVSASISSSSERKPLVVVAPTNTEAEKLFNEKKLFEAQEKLKILNKNAFIRLPIIETLLKKIEFEEQESKEAWEYFKTILN